MKYLIESNYKSIVDRGLITPTTNIYKFLDKLKEEHDELIAAVSDLHEAKYTKQKHFDNINEELADVILVCLNMARHFGIDIERELKIKIKKNEERAKDDTIRPDDSND